MKILFSLILLMLMSFPLKAQEEHHNHAEMTIKMSVEKILKDYKNVHQNM